MDAKILNYSAWKKNASTSRLNEGLFWDVTETEPIKGTTHKIKVKYLDANSFKVKAVNDVDMVTAAGDITPGLIDGIIDFLKSHDRTNFEREYPALADPISFWKDHFFTYNVLRENDRRQVVVFTIQKRANFKGVTPATKILSDNAAAALSQSPEANALLAKSDQSIIQKTPDETAQTPKSSPGAFKEIQLADLTNLTKASPFFKTFDNAVVVLAKSGQFTDRRATDLIDAVIAELEKGQLGKNSELLIKGLMAGLGMSTYVDKYGKTKARTSITQEVYDKLVAMVPTAQNSSRQYYLGLDGRAILEAEELTSPLAGFDMDAFIGVISPAVAPTITDVIKRSEVAGKKDPRVIAFQQLVIDKFAKHPVVGNTSLYKKFASYKADGDYGPTTDAMVAMLKAGLKTSDKDSSTRGDNITPELMQKIDAEKVSESVYLDLNARLVEQFDSAAAEASLKTYKPAGGGEEAATAASKTKKETVDKTKKEATSFSGTLTSDQLTKLGSDIKRHITDAGFSEDLSDSGVIVQLDGISWKYKSVNSSDILAEYSIDDTGKYTANIKGEFPKTITGKLAADMKTIQLDKGVLVLLKGAIRRESLLDVKAKSNINHAAIAGKLLGAMQGGGTYSNNVYNALYKLNTLNDLLEVSNELVDSSDYTLIKWIVGDFEPSEMYEYVYTPLLKGGVMPSFIINRFGTNSYAALYALFDYARKYVYKSSPKHSEKYGDAPYLK